MKVHFLWKTDDGYIFAVQVILIKAKTTLLIQNNAYE